jgi:hypothetical protein
MTEPHSNDLPGGRNDRPVENDDADERQQPQFPFCIPPQPFYRPGTDDRATEDRRLAEYLEQELRALGDEINELPMAAIASRCWVADRFLRRGLTLLEKAGRLRVWRRRHWADRNQYEWLVEPPTGETGVAREPETR